MCFNAPHGASSFAPGETKSGDKGESVGPYVARALDELEWCRWIVAEPRGYSFAARIVRLVVQRELVTPGQRRRVLEAATS